MKTKLSTIGLIALAIITLIALPLAGCGGDDKTEHVHQWGDWIETSAPTCTEAGVETRTCTLDTTHKETRTGAAAIGHQWGEWTETKAPTNTADGEETRICAHNATHKETRPIVTKTYDIELKDGALTFTVEYKAPSEEEPAFLAYIETRLTAVVNSDVNTNVDAVNLLLTKGDSFNITIEYEGDSYTGMNWDIASQSFKMHNDWISTASGTTGDNALTLAMLRAAFNSVTTNEPATREFLNKVMFVEGTTEYYADIKDARTACGSKTLEQILDDNNKNIVERIQAAVAENYKNASGLAGNALKGRYRTVFGNALGENGGVLKIVITIENNTKDGTDGTGTDGYDNYKVGTDFNDLRLSIEYLTDPDTTDADLQAKINSAISEIYTILESMV